MKLSSEHLTKLAKLDSPLFFSMDMALVCSVVVFPAFRSRGITNLIYQGLDSWLANGVKTTKWGIRKYSSIHISCSAPETMHLCQKHGYERIARVVIMEEK